MSKRLPPIERLAMLPEENKQEALDWMANHHKGSFSFIVYLISIYTSALTPKVQFFALHQG